MTPCPIQAGTLSNLTKAIELSESARYSGSVIAANVNDATVAIERQSTLKPGLLGGTHKPGPTRIVKEIGKQAIDQPGHFLIAAAPIWASRYLLGVPWYGWVVAPLLAYREWLQWPSNRWWDPPLDWTFQSLGAVVATYRRGRTRRLPDALQLLRRRIVLGLSFCLATGRRARPVAP
jgi:hypothetical protein